MFESNLDHLETPVEVLKVLTTQSPTAIQIFDSRGLLLFRNKKYIQTFKPSDSPNYCLWNDPQVLKSPHFSSLQKCFEGEILQLTIPWNIATEIHVTMARITPVLKENKVTNVIFMFDDVANDLMMKNEHQLVLKERDDAKSLIQNILNQTKAVIYIKSIEGKIIFINEQFSRIFNLEFSQILGKSDEEIFPLEIAQSFRKNDLQVLKTLSHIEIEETAIHSDGTAHTYISLKFPIFDSTQELIGICGISTDITQHRALERELSNAKRMEAIGLLAGGVAHNFNNIIGIIMLVADTLLLKGSPDKNSWKESIISIKNASQSAALLTRQLLAFGKHQNLEPILLNLGTVVMGAKDILVKAMGEDIISYFHTEPNLWSICADPVDIEQILTNLCLNARDAMPKGGTLKVTISNQHVETKSNKWKIGSPLGAYVQMQVQDNGIGMGQSIVERIFEPFFTTKEEGHGTGLGLATVFGIVKKMNGDIRIESDIGKGSTFTVIFPKSTGNLEINSPLHLTPDSLKGSETILVVEDESTLRGLISSLLKEQGYRVIEAQNANIALSLWSHISKEVNLIITDIIMPEMSGLEMIKKIPSSKIKVLFVSAYSKKRLMEKNSFQQDDYFFLEKPFSATALFSKIREILSTPMDRL